MRSAIRWRRAALTLPELLLLMPIIAAVIYDGWFLKAEGYLPQPFIFDTRDTFMDWFNTAFWAHNGGAYDVWRTVYPPLSFAFLRLFTTASCYQIDPLEVGRSCDIYGQLSIVGFFLLGSVLAFIALHREDRRTGWIRGLAVMLSYPSLFVLERGNLIIPCFVCFVLAYGNLLRDGWMRALAIGMTINFKPYMLMPALGLAYSRQWRMLELAGIFTVGVYLVTYGIVGAGSPFEIVDNTRNWVNVTAGVSLGEVYQTTSYNTFFSVLDHGFRLLQVTDSGSAEFWLTTMRVIMVTTQVLALAALVGAWLQPKAITPQRAALLMLTLSLSQQNPGGYTEVFVLFLVFFERWQRPGQIMALTAAYVLAIPYDYVFARLPVTWSDSWLTGRAFEPYFGVAYGHFLRPTLLLLLLASVAVDTIGQVIRAHRHTKPSLGFAVAPQTAGA